MQGGGHLSKEQLPAFVGPDPTPGEWTWRRCWSTRTSRRAAMGVPARAGMPRQHLRCWVLRIGVQYRSVGLDPAPEAELSIPGMASLLQSWDVSLSAQLVPDVERLATWAAKYGASPILRPQVPRIYRWFLRCASCPRWGRNPPRAEEKFFGRGRPIVPITRQ